MRLNLGSGTDHHSGWTSVDIRPLAGVEVVADVRQLPFPDSTAEAILANDVIEHLPQCDVPPTLREWYRVLQSGGTVEIRTPDWYKIFRAAIMRKLLPEKIFELVFGDQSEAAGGYEAGGHKSGHSASQWEVLLKDIGFVDIQVMEDMHEYNSHILARKP